MKRSRPSWGLCPGVTSGHRRQSEWWTTEPGEPGRKLAHAREDGLWTPGPETNAAPTEARMAVDEWESVGKWLEVAKLLASYFLGQEFWWWEERWLDLRNKGRK